MREGDHPVWVIGLGLSVMGVLGLSLWLGYNSVDFRDIRTAALTGATYFIPIYMRTAARKLKAKAAAKAAVAKKAQTAANQEESFSGFEPGNYKAE